MVMQICKNYGTVNENKDVYDPNIYGVNIQEEKKKI